MVDLLDGSPAGWLWYISAGCLSGLGGEGREGMNALTISLYNRQQARQALTAQVFPYLDSALQGSRRWVLTIRPETRSLQQNALLWATLTDISQQVDWYGRKLTPENWKHVFSAALKKQDVVPGLDGGFVVLGLSTSKMTVGEMAELQELMEAFGAENGVRFTAAES